MGLFSNVETDKAESRGGFLSRLRTPRASFVETASIAEPRFKSTTKPTKPGVSFLGRSLTDDIEDVESTQLYAEPREPSKATGVDAIQREAQTLRALEDVPANNVPEPSAHVSDNSPHSIMESQSLSYAAGAAALRELEAVLAEQDLRGSPHVVRDRNDAHMEPISTPASYAEKTVAVPAAVPDEHLVKNDRSVGAGECQPTVGQSGTARTASASTILSTADEADDNEATAPVGMPGRPTLVSAESLPDFKRILSSTEGDAALKISASARKEFIAVELQPGIALVAATARFCEREQFSTFLKDLVANDLLVKEEMVATEAVIAAIYAGKRDVGTSGVRESSRAIGNFRDLMEAAHSYNASDVHFEPRDFKTEVEVRFRVNGDLYTYRHLPKAIVRRALSAAYSDLVQKNTNSGNAFQPTSPQSAMIPLVLRKDTVNLRWQSSPSVGGYDVALRLLDGNFKNYSVRMPDQMGLAPSQLALIETLNYVSRGITVLTGETGSGKTTLLRALSYMLPDRDLKKQFAVSEPAEYPQPWLSEYSIIRRPDETDDEANRKYAEVIRTLMREDPDDLTINEVRDHVVMGLVAELALTGHPVRFSLHAGDIISAVMRMAGGRLKLPIDELAAEGFINAVGNQKLVPTLCENCKIPAADVMDRADLVTLETKFGLDTSKMACRDTSGCKKCRLEGLFTRLGKVAGGTTGQTLVAEFYRPTPEFLDHVSVRDWAGARRVWRGERTTSFDKEDMTGKTLYEHALFKASCGDIDPQFINRSMQSFAQYRVMPGVDGLK
ncbi:Type II secretory pathway ATPase GspE/PulE or T4P pilus assembly pathway ATPase PilB [Burkholderia sp. D7]|nr:Type II secretory pathway ATPase GspE/PulE or T4P pilus assembly pathway ATPase PilB [Burkholderia sp. D7]